MRARVIVLAGPSGAGKSRLAERLGLPVLRLDDFYKNGDDPTLPVITHGANAGLTDWDHPDSWLPDDAIATLDPLCREGRAEVPIYDIAHDGRCGSQTLDLGGHRLFVAEGIFAQDVVPPCGDAGLLAAAYCVRQHAVVTFWRRLTRDLRERRKPPLVLVRRGLGADARPAPGRRRRRRQGLPPGHARRGVRRDHPARGARTRRWLTPWCRPGPLPSSGGGSPSRTRPPAARPAWSWPAILARRGVRRPGDRAGDVPDRGARAAPAG